MSKQPQTDSKIPSQKLLKPPKHVVLESLVDFLNKELDSKFDEHPKGTPRSIHTPRELIEARLGDQKGGTESKFYDEDDDEQELEMSPAMSVLVKILVVAFVVFCYFGFFKPTTTINSMISLLNWVITSVKINTPKAVTIIENFSVLANKALHMIFIEKGGLKAVGFVSVVGVIYGMQWKKISRGVAGGVRVVKTSFLATFHKLMASFNDKLIEPIAKYVLRPVAMLVLDVTSPVKYLADICIHGVKKLLNIVTDEPDSSNGNHKEIKEYRGGMMIAGNHPKTRSIFKIK